jgi:hypothetical protein
MPCAHSWHNVSSLPGCAVVGWLWTLIIICLQDVWVRQIISNLDGSITVMFLLSSSPVSTPGSHESALAAEFSLPGMYLIL